MISLDKLKIYIISIDKEDSKALENQFKGINNVTVINDDIINFYNSNSKEIDCLVSPANSYGYMTGGYDAALSEILGPEFVIKVQAFIKKHYYGEQPVATSFIMDTDIEGLKFIHTPTMQHPSPITDDFIIYQCMRTTLISALRHDVKCIVIPVFGTATGEIDSIVAAKRMYEGYMQVKNKSGAKYRF